MNCTICGCHLPDGAKFCLECGSSIDSLNFAGVTSDAEFYPWSEPATTSAPWVGHLEIMISSKKLRRSFPASDAPAWATGRADADSRDAARAARGIGERIPPVCSLCPGLMQQVFLISTPIEMTALPGAQLFYNAFYVRRSPRQTN